MSSFVVAVSLLLGTLAGASLAVRVLGGAPRWPGFVFLGAFLPLLTYPGLQFETFAAFGAGFVLALHVLILIFKDRGGGGWRPGDDSDLPDPPWWPGFERDLERYGRGPAPEPSSEREKVLVRRCV